MDRQAFRNRMQQLKQYREQNPGKTYLDFKKYANGGETGEDEKQWLMNWYTKRRLYANQKARYINKQLDVIENILLLLVVMPMYRRIELVQIKFLQ